MSHPPIIETGFDQVPEGTSEAFVAMLVTVATNAWRAQARLRNTQTADPDRRRLEREIGAIVDGLREFGLQIEDHTGQAFDFGQALVVLASEPRQGIAHELVTETIRPTVRWGKVLLQRGEVVIATPERADS